jgi:hypothetical protein
LLPPRIEAEKRPNSIPFFSFTIKEGLRGTCDIDANWRLVLSPANCWAKEGTTAKRKATYKKQALFIDYSWLKPLQTK